MHINRIALTSALIVASLTLTGCSLVAPTATTPTAEIPSPVSVPDPSAAPDEGSQTGVTELNLTAEVLAAEIPAGQSLFLRGTVAQAVDGWTASFAPATKDDVDIAMFTNGGVSGDGMMSNPTLQAMRPGKTVLSLTNSLDPQTVITIYITVVTSKAYEELLEADLALEDEEIVVLTIKEQAEELSLTVVGMTEADASRKIFSNGFEARVVSRNGEVLPGTKDYLDRRINLTVDGDKVTAVSVG